MKNEKIIGEYYLGATKWKIKEEDRDNENNNAGITFPAETKIEIYNNIFNTPQSKENKNNTIHHEVVHSILATMGRHELNQDEEFVQVFGTFMEQFHKTFQIKEEIENNEELSELQKNISDFEDFLIGYESEMDMGVLDQYRIDFEKHIKWTKDDKELKKEAKKLVKIPKRK